MELNEMKAKFTIIASEAEYVKIREFLKKNNIDAEIYYECKSLLTNNNKPIKE